jgi:hypothetical protein
MEFQFHVSDGLAAVDAFWEARGLARSREPLLFAGYSRGTHRHTIYLHWAREHDSCVNVYVGIDARTPADVWPRRSAKEHRLLVRDFRNFIAHVRALPIHGGVRVRYGYPWDEAPPGIVTLPHARVVSLSVEVLDEKEKPAIKVAYEKRRLGWAIIVEPLSSYPFPEGADVLQPPYALGCSLGESFVRGAHEQSKNLPG